MGVIADRALALILSATVVTCASTAQSMPAQQPAPNVIFVLAEGQGWASTSVPMDDRVPASCDAPGLTPNLERLAREGTRFSDFYASAPRCTPSRASLITGMSPARLRVTYVLDSDKKKDDDDADELPSTTRVVPPHSEHDLPEGVLTTADRLRAAGFGTAHFGKWQVGKAGPRKRGFDVTDPKDDESTKGVSRSTVITSRGIAFMKEQVTARRPFYLQLWHVGAGADDEVTRESRARARNLLHDVRGKELDDAAGMVQVDAALGRLLDAVDSLGIAERTFIVFSSDHGAAAGSGRGANFPLQGGKGSVAEGGLRVPFLVRGPGVRAGVCSHVRACGMDLLPTILELAGKGAESAGGLDGGSLAPVLLGTADAVKRPRGEIVIHFPHFDLGNGGPQSALFFGDFKLIRNDETQGRRLYRITSDPFETRDLSGELPDTVTSLTERLDAWLNAIDAPRARPRTPAPAAQDSRPESRGSTGGR